MPRTKVVVCLANSKKLGHRCVAGIELVRGNPRDWIRPVSARNGHAVSLAERELPGNEEPAPLDILRIPLLIAQPEGHQTENWLLNPDRRWTKTGELPWEDLEDLVDAPTDLWGKDDSSNKGENDRVAEDEALELTNSLALVFVKSLKLHVLTTYYQQKKREVRAIFKYRRVSYDLAVTDPRYTKAYLQAEDGHYPLGPCYMTVSLAEPVNGFCYKVIAAILEPEGPPEENQ
jgi:hypothetical protein